ncbi:MAG: hypothetical protein CW716_01690 [Candidatus Bathyarchaeum sp.]|nr:MAG: hypothetical protein CW716_01690 [Candidatus Bathyarchaeum sp.]
MIDEILNVAKELWSIRQTFNKAKQDKREKMATYFENISSCLEQASATLRGGEIPHGKCGQMLGYARMFPETVEGVISEEKAEEFTSKLIEAHGIEHATKIGEKEFADAVYSDQQIGKIEEASGQFQALADSIRAI